MKKLALVLLLAATASAQQFPILRPRPSLPLAVPSTFESVRFTFWRGNQRYTNSNEDPLDLPTVACTLTGKWTRPGNGRGSEGITIDFPAIDTSCGGDQARWIVLVDLPVPEFNGEGASGPWQTMGTCDSLLWTVTLKSDLPGVSGRLWGTREVAYCWRGFMLQDRPTGRRRAAGR